ncbi:Retaining alpha-galactosidase [Mucilaginibacter sp. PPCGB 2223]|nr:Retaining alpha-galactosidase [Mucilaginibacter sp. PPCGB 2223]
MNAKLNFLVSVLILIVMLSNAKPVHVLSVKSPDGKITLQLENDAQIKWSVSYEGIAVIAPSKISLTLNDGEVLGSNAVISSCKTLAVNNTIVTPIYKKQSIINQYNELTINFKGDYGLILRAYNDGVAYRFFIKRPGGITIKNEEANFNFMNDHDALIPYVRDIRNNDIYMSAFEALYEHIKLSGFKKDTLAFTPVLVDLGNNRKAAIMEADLEDYPGMFLKRNNTAGLGFHGDFAHYPLKEKKGGFSDMNYVVTERAGYIAKTISTRNLPWRVALISADDKELANNDMVQKLASPCRISDISWIKPGKVAWDWWNDWNISKVEFKAGINTATYKYYADFASANKLQYIILDEGWSEQTDMMKIVPAINLQEIIDHAKQKNVDVILWASWYAIDQRMDEAFAKYSKMGVKGFKIDFLDRDDQKMVASCYKIAQKAAQYHLLIDFHGMYKPTGLQRTFPNIINFEGVKGMENEKWTTDDVPGYDVTLPFIRMLAGPLDYTPGAMRNAIKPDFRPSNSNPMSQGTRCHQLAMYVVFEAPLAMLADSPTAYMKEQECTDFISKIPTTFDETVVLDGKVGEHVAIARKKSDTWYVGAMTNWDAREINLDMSFLGSGIYEAELFRDGVNADKDATDYKREIIKLSSKDKLKIVLGNGGGWIARIYPVKN